MKLLQDFLPEFLSGTLTEIFRAFSAGFPIIARAISPGIHEEFSASIPLETYTTSRIPNRNVQKSVSSRAGEIPIAVPKIFFVIHNFRRKPLGMPCHPELPMRYL